MPRSGFPQRKDKAPTCNAPSLRYLAALLVTLAAVSGLFLFLNGNFNKYTSPGVQPINGIIYLNEAELEAVPVHHLINGWEFYPQQLLTPEDLDDEEVEISRRYLPIGTFNTFALGNVNAQGHGSGTYVLTLMLPEAPDIYSLSLPEVYSAYRLYLNGQLISFEGNPDQANYSDATRSKTLTFTASGQTTLMLSTTNYSSLYDGLIFPPAFGKAEAIFKLDTTRTSLSSFFIFVLATTLIWTVFTAIYSRRNRPVAILLSLVAFFGLMLVSHYNLHRFLTLPVQPWQTFEVLSLYLVISLVVAVHNNVCSVGRRGAFFSSVVCLAFLASIAVLYSFALTGSSQAALALSSVTTLFKVLASGYVIIVSALAKSYLPYSMVLFVMDVAFATSLMWDRILSQYESIFDAWFTEWSIIAFCLGSLLCIMQDILRGHISNIRAKSQIKAMKRQLEIQEDYLNCIEEKERTIRTLRHDFRQHARVLAELSRERNFHDLESYLAQMDEPVCKDEFQRLAANNELNALLQYYGLRARSLGVAFSCKVSLPKDLGEHTVSISIILGNALENALDAAEEYARKHAAEGAAEPGAGAVAAAGFEAEAGAARAETAGAAGAADSRAAGTARAGAARAEAAGAAGTAAFVSLQASTKAHQALYVIENSFYELKMNEKGKLLSTKHPEEGLGFESIRSTVAELGGYCSFSYEDEPPVFKLMISIPL